MDQVRTGLLRGTGAAVNVQLGWIPEVVIVTNHTDGDKIHMGFPGYQVIVFTSGGTTPIVRGGMLVGATSGAKARVSDVIVDTGSWAGGDAAGWIVIDRPSKVGTFTTEAAYVEGNAGGSVDQASIVVDVNFAQDIDTEVASATGNASIAPYVGTTTAALGFTLGSTISEDAKLLGWVAFRSGPGGSGRASANSL